VRFGRSRGHHLEIWDASHTRLVALWQFASHLFPLALVRRARLLKPSRDVALAAAAYGQAPTIFFSAILSCGHVVRIPQQVAARAESPKRCKPIVPCYRCWAAAGNGLTGLVCSFCGVPHGFEQSCMRPHLDE